MTERPSPAHESRKPSRQHNSIVRHVLDGVRDQRVDVLAKVRLVSGQEQWILLHLEIQSSYEEGFVSRLSRYNAGIYWICQRRVMTLVVLADLRRGWVPDEDVFRVGGSRAG